jgi:rRNA maturation RNase YbeY
MPLHIHNTTRRPISEGRIEQAVLDVLEGEGLVPESVIAVFCGNRMIRRINREFLQHDYPTDTITFRYNHGPAIEGEVYISLDVVEENAGRFNTSFDDELMRVIVHSALHLAGWHDRTPEERDAMRLREDAYLNRMRTS